MDAADPDSTAGQQGFFCSLFAPSLLKKFDGGPTQPFDNDGKFQFII
jgi:hypothetical protein